MAVRLLLLPVVALVLRGVVLGAVDRPHGVDLRRREDPYPGDELVEGTTRDFCGDSASAWLEYPLQYAEWRTGNGRSICWAWTTG